MNQTISLEKLQEIINKLYDDVGNDLKTLEESKLKNQGALLGLSTLINRINEFLTTSETPEVMDAEVTEETDHGSGENGVPV